MTQDEETLLTERVFFGFAAYLLISGALFRVLSYLYVSNILKWLKALDEEMAYTILSIVFDIQILGGAMLLMIFTFYKIRRKVR